MSSIAAQNRSFFTIPASTKPSLPVSHSDVTQHVGGLRRRLSSLSLKVPATPVSVSSWSFPRSKSLSSMGDYAGTSIRKWWAWSWAWILSRKPIIATDLAMNEQETKLLGSWRHVYCKVRSEIIRFISSDQVGLPQTYRYHHAS